MTPTPKKQECHCRNSKKWGWCLTTGLCLCKIKSCELCTPSKQVGGGCHCGKNGHALNSINCPVHGYKAHEAYGAKCPYRNQDCPKCYPQRQEKVREAEKKSPCCNAPAGGFMAAIGGKPPVYHEMCEKCGNQYRPAASMSLEEAEKKCTHQWKQYSLPKPHQQDYEMCVLCKVCVLNRKKENDTLTHPLSLKEAKELLKEIPKHIYTTAEGIEFISKEFTENLLAAQALVSKEEEKERAAKIINEWFLEETESNRGSRLVYEHLIESRNKIIQSLNPPQNDACRSENKNR